MIKILLVNGSSYTFMEEAEKKLRIALDSHNHMPGDSFIEFTDEQGLRHTIPGSSVLEIMDKEDHKD